MKSYNVIDYEYYWTRPSYHMQLQCMYMYVTVYNTSSIRNSLVSTNFRLLRICDLCGIKHVHKICMPLMNISQKYLVILWSWIIKLPGWQGNHL